MPSAPYQQLLALRKHRGKSLTFNEKKGKYLTKSPKNMLFLPVKPLSSNAFAPRITLPSPSLCTPSNHSDSLVLQFDKNEKNDHGIAIFDVISDELFTKMVM